MVCVITTVCLPESDYMNNNISILLINLNMILFFKVQSKQLIYLIQYL